jgi:IS5 family transposase
VLFYELGHAGDAVNALLCAAGHNLRLILNRLRALFALILALLSATANRNTLPSLVAFWVTPG